MLKRFFFPVFNSLIGALLGALVGILISPLVSGLILGAAAGLIAGVSIEYAAGRKGLQSWVYRRRVLLSILVETLLVIILIGPAALVIAETRSDQHPVCCETPLDYGAESYQEVMIKGQDNILLAGWFVPPREVPGPTVILLHGAHGDRRATSWHAEQLIAAGYGVLMYDQRALGESTGQLVSFGWYDGPDLVAVLDDLKTRPEVDPEQIGVVGISGGAHIALNAAYLSPGSISGGMWLDGIQAQRIADFPDPENVGERFATLMNRIVLFLAEIRLQQSAPPPFISIIPELDHIQMLVVASGKDDFERRVNLKYADVLGHRAELWMIDQAEHVGGPSTVPEEYKNRMLDFFQSIFDSES